MMVLYTKNNCSACENAKTFLATTALEYKVVNIEEDYESAMGLVRDGIRSVPVLEDTASGERFIGAEAIKASV